MTTHEIVLTAVVGVPLLFYLGRLSNRITWFHATAEERYTVKEFMRSRE